MSISFDRAAPYYDRTRALDPGVLAQLIATVRAALPEAGRVIEVGVGTGRVALPLKRAGVDIVGVDISPQMLARLRANAAADPPPLVVADATRLPFAGATFAGAVAAHVLHLIPAWRDAVTELARVVRPGGVVVASRGGRTHGSGWWVATRGEFFRLAGDPAWPPGMDRIEELDAEMSARGAEVTRLPEIRQETEATVSELLRMLEDGVWSACWSMEPETRQRAAAKTREWAASSIGDLDEKRELVEVLAWRAYRLP